MLHVKSFVFYTSHNYVIAFTLIMFTYCINTKSQLSADAGNDKMVCENEEIIIGGSPSASGGSGDYSYSWSPTTGLDNPTSANPVITAMDNITYSLTVTDNINAASANDIVNITVTPLPEVNAGNDKSVCLYGDIVNISLFGRVEGSSTTGEWISRGDGNFPLGNDILSTSYTLGAGDKTKDSIYLVLSSTNKGICPPVSDSFKLFIYPRSEVNVGNDQVYCENIEEVSLNGNITGGSTTGKWYTNGKGAFEPNPEDLNAIYIPHKDDIDTGKITFILVSTGLLGCAGASDTLKVTFIQSPRVSAGEDTTVNSRSVKLNGWVNNVNTFYWETTGTGNFFPDNLSLLTNYYFGNEEISMNSEVTIILHAENPGCPWVNDSVIVKSLFTDIPNAFSPNDDGINDYFMRGEYIEIYNRWGQLLYNGIDGWDGRYKGEKVGNGTYFYVIKNNEGQVSLKGSVTILNDKK